MALDEDLRPGGPGAQVVDLQHALVRGDHGADAGALLLRQLAVHQHVERPGGDLPGVVEDVGGNAAAEQRTDAGPANMPRAPEPENDGAVDKPTPAGVTRVRPSRHA